MKNKNVPATRERREAREKNACVNSLEESLPRVKHYTTKLLSSPFSFL